MEGGSLEQRLLRDIAELQTDPYPNIEVYFEDEDLTEACLILTSEGYGSMHLTVEIPTEYPLKPPKFRMDSQVSHPNVEGHYICASILITQEGYTSAYTLKSIAIQLLSFFSSDRIEQAGGAYSENLEEYRYNGLGNMYICHRCQYGISEELKEAINGCLIDLDDDFDEYDLDSSEEGSGEGLDDTASTPPIRDGDSESLADSQDTSIPSAEDKEISEKGDESRLAQFEESLSQLQVTTHPTKSIQEFNLPKEVLLLICEKLETEQLMLLAEAWPQIGSLITQFDMIRTRELVCFCLKHDYTVAELGVGVTMTPDGKIPMLESEFDLVSLEAYYIYGVRRSVQGLPFEHWLALPISPDHWQKVRESVYPSLVNLRKMAQLYNRTQPYQIIYHFMNDVLVKLNKQVNKPTLRSPYYPWEEVPKSTLTHASEKAVESYFHLFHLLLCLATEDPTIVEAANDSIRSFCNGQDSKESCPNIGHLLVASLISSVEITPNMMKIIVREAITRNVVWTLTAHPELAYLEPSSVSMYRLVKTFQASKTSYRILMFQNLFRKTACGTVHNSLTQIRDEVFKRHGAPPRGTTKQLVDSIKRIHEINHFSGFLTEMGLGGVGPAFFTKFLRGCVNDSVAKGYSRHALGQGHALLLRLTKEPNVEKKDVGVLPTYLDTAGLNFFPGGRGGCARQGEKGRVGGVASSRRR